MSSHIICYLLVCVYEMFLSACDNVCDNPAARILLHAISVHKEDHITLTVNSKEFPVLTRNCLSCIGNVNIDKKDVFVFHDYLTAISFLATVTNIVNLPLYNLYKAFVYRSS
jgi:hypothetical protein